jgi:hypothetical protein
VHPPLTRRALALRLLGLVVAVGLSAVGVWLVVTSTSQKGIRLGALAGLWGLLIGAFVAFGARRQPETVLVMADPDAEPGTALVPATSGAVVRLADADAQRDHEARLEQLLREIQASFAREVTDLRSELSALRTELLDKVGGQIAHDHNETTRIIGSDLEAIQREIRELREDADRPRALPNGSPRPSPSPVPAEVVEAEVVEVEDESAGYRGRRRRDETADGDGPTVGRDSPEGEALLARLLSREPT